MTTATADASQTKALALPEPVTRRGLNAAEWNTLCRSLYPGANPNSVLLVVDYCRARKLDPLKKPCHIVPMEVKDAKTGAFEWRDVVMPGIYELRTTAQRTELYLGHSEPTYGPEIEVLGVKAPEWCAMTIYRWNETAKQRAEFPVKVFFREVVATKRNKKTQAFEVNARWTKAPVQMLTKCTEAAGLREACPDELGGQQTAEEMDGQRAIDVEVDTKPLPPKPDGYDDWLALFAEAATAGETALGEAWAKADPAYRSYLTTTNRELHEALKARAKGDTDVLGDELREDDDR